jgi:hypothetical protein
MHMKNTSLNHSLFDFWKRGILFLWEEGTKFNQSSSGCDPPSPKFSNMEPKPEKKRGVKRPADNPSKQKKSAKKPRKTNSAENEDDTKPQVRQRRLNDHPRISITAGLVPGSVFKHGMPQLTTEMRLLDGHSNPIPDQVLAPRHEQNMFTLAPPRLRPLAAFFHDTGNWHNGADAHATTRQIYGPTIFARVASIRYDPTATKEQQRAAKLVSVTTMPEAQMVLSDRALIRDVDEPHLISIPPPSHGGVKPKHQRPIRLANTSLANIRPTKAGSPADDDNIVDVDADEVGEAGEADAMDIDLPIMPTTTTTTARTLTPKQRQQQRFQQERFNAFLCYYPDDPEPDPELPFGLDPLDYPSFRACLEDAGQQEAWLNRTELLRNTSEKTARANVQHVHKVYLAKYRCPIQMFPPQEKAFRRPCCSGPSCQVHVLAVRRGHPLWGYNPPEFIPPREEKMLLEAVACHREEVIESWLNQPTGPCIECLLLRWTREFSLYQQASGKPPPHPINTIQVEVCEGEYCREVCHPIELEGVSTGMEGHVPVYDASKREFECYKPGSFMVLREVEVDFRMRRSQINAWLGVPKARPLAGAQGVRCLPLHPQWDQIVSGPNNGSENEQLFLWQHYKNTLPVFLLADRALIQHVHESETMSEFTSRSRVPAIWLRRYALENMGETTPEPQLRVDAAMKSLSECIPTTTIVCLYHAFTTFGDSASNMKRPPDPPDLRTMIHFIAAALAHMAAVALAPFEVTMDWLLEIQQQDEYVTQSLVSPILRLILDPESLPSELQILQRHGDNLARPPSQCWSIADPLRKHQQQDSWIVYTACIFRIGVIMLLNDIVHPCRTLEQSIAREIEFNHIAHLFMDNHLDLLTRLQVEKDAFENGSIGTDRWFFQTPDDREPRLTRLYPQLTRACCFEEMIWMTPVLFSMNQWCDPPSKKGNTAQLDSLIHLLLKTLPHVCLIRGADNIFAKHMKQWPLIHALMVQIMRCFWLGNLPQAQGRPPLPVRIKINATFAPVSAIFEVASEELENAQAKRIQDWAHKHPVLMLSILREYNLAAIEASGSLDDIRSQSVRWINFKSVVRMCNGVMRKFVTSMVQKTGNVDWNILEEREKGSSKGEIMKWHEKQKLHNTKLYKDSDYGIMLKKMRNEDSKLEFDPTLVRKWLESNNRLQYLHVVAWVTAHVTHRPLENGLLRPAVLTGMLKCLGMSEEGYRRLRERLHVNAEYYSSDNSFCAFAVELYKNNWRDYVLLNMYLRLVGFYMDDVMHFTSIGHARNQIMGLRQNLFVPGTTCTPPGLGIANFCEGCGKWTHPVAKPSREYLGYPLTAIGNNTAVAGADGTDDDDGDDIDDDSDNDMDREHLEHASAVHAALAAKKQALRNKKKKKSMRPRPHEPKSVYLANGLAGTSINVAYNPSDTKLYCINGNVDKTQQEIDALVAPLMSGALDGVEDMDSVDNVMYGEDEDEDEDDDDDGEEADVESGVIDQIFKEHVSCDTPLLSVDLVGVYKRHRGRLYGRCVYCGCICEVFAANMTNAGLSCGEHALVDEYPEWHRIWNHIIRPSFTLRDSKHPSWIKSYPGASIHRPCIKCRHVDAAGPIVFWIYDASYRLAKVSLCRHHAAPLRSVQHVPLRIDFFMSRG